MTFFPDVAHSHRLSFSWLHSIVWIYSCVHSTVYRHSVVSSLGRWWIALLWTFQCVHACRTYTGKGLPRLRCFQLLELLPGRFSKWLYQLTFLSAVFDGCSTCSSDLLLTVFHFVCFVWGCKQSASLQEAAGCPPAKCHLRPAGKRQKKWTPLTQIGKNVVTVHSHPERSLLGSASTFLIHPEPFCFVSGAGGCDGGSDWDSEDFLHSGALSHLQVMGYLGEGEAEHGNWLYFRATRWLGRGNLFRGFENSSCQTLQDSQVCASVMTWQDIWARRTWNYKKRKTKSVANLHR